MVREAPLREFVRAEDILPPALLKLDVQGYELEALRGCEDLLRRFAYVYAECSFVELYAGGREPEDLVRERGLEQVSDAAPLESAVRSTLDRFPEQVSAYRSGKTQLLAFFVGHVMRATGGRGNPRTVQALLERMLG